jgi:phosphate starvation-inducible protein PhoH
MGKRSKKEYEQKRIQKGEHESVRHAQQMQPQSDSRIILTPKTPNQKTYLHTIRSCMITVCSGPAGSGKSILPIGYALQNIMCRPPKYEKIIVVRSVKEAGGEEMGFLPGSLEEKFMPWMGPIIDNLKVFLSDGAIEVLFRHKKIEALPLAYARGRSLNNCFVILDEAQNCTPEQILMILTRIGENTKLVLNGDMQQSDLDKGVQSGLSDVIEKLSKMKGVGVCELTPKDIVRNPLISEILYRYGKINATDYQTEIENNDNYDDLPIDGNDFMKQQPSFLDEIKEYSNQTEDYDEDDFDDE